MKNILLVCDVENWAWAHKAKAIKKYLENTNIKIDIICGPELKQKDLSKYSHIHSFDFHIDVPFNKSSTTVASYNFELKNIKNELALMNRFSKIVCVSPLIYNKLINYNIPVSKLYKCYNGVDETLFFPINREYSFNRPIKIGWCGQPATKNGDQHGSKIMENIINILKDNNNFEFFINSKNYTNCIPFNQMNEYYYNKIDIIIHTGLATGTPNTVYEAVCSGAMAMGTRIGCMEELITDGVNGYLFDKPNIDQITKYGIPDEINRCSKQIVDCLINLEKNRDLIKTNSELLRKEVLDKWLWKIRAQDWLKVIL